MKYSLGFIGCGNMGGALVTAAAKKVDGTLIAVCDHNPEKVEKLQNTLGVVGVTAEEIAREAELVVLGVKPQAMEATLAPIAGILRERENVTVVTMAAGLSISAIRSYIGKDVPVIRIMPNTPVSLGAGMSLFTCNGVDGDTKGAFLFTFEESGWFDEVPENQIDAGGALTGCGPAFVYAFAKALADGAAECGISKDKAALYAAQTLLGAAKMLLEYGNPDDLIRAVCSPGGTTIAGMRALEEADFYKATASAVLAAYKRTLELKK